MAVASSHSPVFCTQVACRTLTESLDSQGVRLADSQRELAERADRSRELIEEYHIKVRRRGEESARVVARILVVCCRLVQEEAGEGSLVQVDSGWWSRLKHCLKQVPGEILMGSPIQVGPAPAVLTTRLWGTAMVV